MAGDHPGLEVLRRQLAEADVSRRELTGVGFFLHFTVASSAPRLPVDRWVIGDVGFDVDGVQHGGGALLFIRDGAVRTLEAYTHAGEPWPADAEDVTPFYTARGRQVGPAVEILPATSRDLSGLAASYSAIPPRA